MNNTFKTIAKFQYSSEAQIIKGRLESDGIQVFLSDNITIDTDPLISNAIGGIKLKVLNKDEERAKEILDSIQQYSTDDYGKPIVCPNCHKSHVELITTIKGIGSFFSFLIGFVTGTLPFSARYKYKCDDCNTEFPTQ